MIYLGILLMLVAAGAYVYQHPEVLKELGGIFIASSQTVVDAKASAARSTAEEPLPMVADEVPPTVEEQLGKLTPGHFVELTREGDVREMQVNGVVTYHERRQYGTKDFDRSGTTWSGLVLFEDWLLAKINGTWYLFDKETDLTADEARAFQPAAEQFGEKENQRRGSVSLDWNGQTWPMFDIGMADVDTQGQAHLSSGDWIRFILAEQADGTILYIEHVKHGPGFAWVGRKVNPDDLVTKIT